MWCCYRFTLDTAAQRDLDSAARAFADAIVDHFEGDAYWTVATAPPPKGGVEVWFSLPQLPTDSDFAPVWNAQLRVHALASERVRNRT